MEKIFPMEHFADTLCDEQLADKIAKIFNEYNYFDLCRAVFCLNSYRYNRAHLQFYLTLNYALLICERNGSTSISDYKEFTHFFNKVKSHFSSMFDDEITPDFGDIKIFFNDKFFPVFIGTGHGFVFPFMQSLFSLCKVLNIVEDIEEVLFYVKRMVQSLSQTNRLAENIDLMEFNLPPEDFFIACKSWYNTMDETALGCMNILTNIAHDDIAEIHFISVDNTIYPLFNPSILIDAFNVLCRRCDQINNLKSRASTIALFKTLQDNFDIDPEAERLLDNVGIVKNKKPLEIVEDLLFDFVILGNEHVLFFINENNIKGKSIKDIIQTTTDLAKSKKLNIIKIEDQPLCKVMSLNEYQHYHFIIYDNEINLGNIATYGCHNGVMCWYLYDLITILLLANSVDDVGDFIQYINMNHFEIEPFCNGYSTYFHVYEKQNKQLLLGAHELVHVVTEVYIVEWHIFQQFLDLNTWYPFDNSLMFSNPFAWIISKTNNDFILMMNKGIYGYGGYFRRIDTSYIFFVFNLGFEQEKMKISRRSEAIRLIDDINLRNVVLFESILKDSGIFAFSGIHLIYLPMNYANSLDNTNLFKNKRKYVYSECSHFQDKLLIRYAVNEEKLMQDICNIQDKSVECEYFIELFECLKDKYNFNFEYFANKIKEKSGDKKDITAIAIDLKYYFSENNIGLKINDEDYVKVRKMIAFACKRLNIESGIYSAKEATKVIRKIQKSLIKTFENDISRFDKYKLHQTLLSILACNVHNKNINYKRYILNNDANISDESKAVVNKNIFFAREKNKEKIKDILYLIETNLAIYHIENNNLEFKDIKYLIAFSHWLNVLQDVSDNAYYNLFDTKIEIENDFLVSTIVDDEQMEEGQKRGRRSYDNKDYRPTAQNDEKNILEAVQCFYQDSGVKFEKFCLICQYLSREFQFTFKNEVIPDVFILSEEDIKSDIKNWLSIYSEQELLEVFNALEFLIMDESKIKTVNGKLEEVIPLWNREGRNYSFIFRPVVRNGSKIIFSPVIVYELLTMWEYGITNFYLPYEYGFDRLKKFTAEWKRECEKQMERDIKKIMSDHFDVVRQNVWLHKIDKTGNHPTNLGDYDIIAIDKVNKIVWNLESKFLDKLGSLREYYNHQYSFFITNKKSEKFTLRIKYIEENLEKILKIFGVADYQEYTVRSYMVTNKIFYADIKSVDFDIITINELESLINKS